MLEIYEITGTDRVEKLSEKFGVEATPMDRAFVMEDTALGREIGLGVIGLVGGTVIIKSLYVEQGQPFFSYDLLVRAVLNVLRNFAPIKVKLPKTDVYFERFGFKQVEGGMEVVSDEINLSGYCGAKE